MEELNARIDEAEAEIDRGEGKTFEEMMSGFKQQLLWLKLYGRSAQKTNFIGILLMDFLSLERRLLTKRIK